MQNCGSYLEFWENTELWERMDICGIHRELWEILQDFGKERTSDNLEDIGVEQGIVGKN